MSSYPFVSLICHAQKERKKKWDEKNQEAIAQAVKQLDEFDKVYLTPLEDNSNASRDSMHASAILIHFLFSLSCYLYLSKCFSDE